MSLLSAIILPKLEKELLAIEPNIAQFIIQQVKSVGDDIVMWAEQKLANNDHKVDSDG
jgi:hypothetical protein